MSGAPDTLGHENSRECRTVYTLHVSQPDSRAVFSNAEILSPNLYSFTPSQPIFRTGPAYSKSGIFFVVLDKTGYSVYLIIMQWDS